MNLFQFGKIVLRSGKESHLKIECDALTQQDWTDLAMLVVTSRIIPPFSHVTGVPRGGNLWSAALLPYCTPGANLHLFVDDVWTTGGSMMRHSLKSSLPTYGLVLFARGPLLVPNVSALFTLHEGIH